MRAVLVLIAIVLILSLVGWISFHRAPDGPSVKIETEHIRKDTKDVVQSGANLLHKAGDEVQQAVPPNDNRPPGESNQPANENNSGTAIPNR
jgi:hypothetical protein